MSLSAIHDGSISTTDEQTAKMQKILSENAQLLREKEQLQLENELLNLDLLYLRAVMKEG